MDYMPSNDAELIPWGKNLATEAPGANEVLKLPAEQVAQVIAANNAMQEKRDAAIIAMAAATKAQGEKREAKKAFKATARAFANQAKASPGYTDETGKQLRIYVTPVSKKLEDYKPVFTAKETGGEVHLNFAKNGVHGFNFYSPDPGSNVFKLIGTGIQSPFIDPRPATQTGVSQLNQYKAMAIEKNKEIGQWSDIVTISYKG